MTNDGYFAVAEMVAGWPLRQLAAAVLAAGTMAAVAASRQKTGEMVQRRAETVGALLLGLLWVTALDVVPWTADGWLLATCAMVMLFLTRKAGSSDMGAPAPAGLRVATGAVVLVTAGIVALRVAAPGGELMNWEPEVIQGLVHLAVPGRPYPVQVTGEALRWGFGLVSSSWDSLLYGPPTAVLLALFGGTVPALRVVPALWALASLPLLGLLGRRLGGAVVGWLAVVVGAVQPALVLYAGYGVAVSATIAAVLAATLAVVEVLAGERGRWWTGALAGVALAAATFGYAPGRVAVVVLIAILIGSVVGRAVPIDHQRVAAVAIVLGAMVALLAVQVHLGVAGRFLEARGEQILTLSPRFVERFTGSESLDGGRARLALTMVRRTWPEAAMVLGTPLLPTLRPADLSRRDPPRTPYYFAPLLPFAAWGLAISLRRMSSPPHAVLLGLLAAATLPMLLTTRSDAHRMIVATIPITVWAALGLAEAGRLARRWGVEARILTTVGVTTLVLAAASLASLTRPPRDPEGQPLRRRLVAAFEGEPGTVSAAVFGDHRALGELSLADLGSVRAGGVPRLTVVAGELVDGLLHNQPESLAALTRAVGDGTLLLAPADRWQVVAEALVAAGWRVDRGVDGADGFWVARPG